MYSRHRPPHSSSLTRLREAFGVAVRSSHSPRSQVLVFAVIFWVFAFPKGGFKYLEIPITWSYVGISALVVWSLAKYAATPAKFLPGIFILAPILPFSILYIFLFFYNGYSSIGFTISAIVSFFAIPVFFLVFLRPLFSSVRAGVLFSAALWGVRVAVVYGLFLYIYHYITGSYFEIPYITVNASDTGDLGDKYNNRGSFHKLFSTYNNGNIYGTCMYMVLPIYSAAERRRLLYAACIATVILTSSRSAYLGLSVALFCSALARGISISIAVRWTGIGLFACAGLYLFLNHFGLASDFLFDANLGGRRAGMAALVDAGFFSAEPSGGWLEMNYVASIIFTGYAGALLYCIHLWTPLFWKMPTDPTTKLHANLLKAGLVAYALGGFFDGATLLIPVMAIFWFLATWLSLYCFRV